ncbi:hypothetical protein ACH347_36885 [Saccharopolyspora sp. 5N102]|uniref:hypothetical protein n=1 Tax=Saccharopolyspora sp. 5N102 TaxID=3375155 RepID=UPI0037B9EE3C
MAQSGQELLRLLVDRHRLATNLAALSTAQRRRLGLARVDRAAKQTLVQPLQEATNADPELPHRLTRLLAVPEDSRISELERLRRGPTRVSGRSMTEALHRASELAGIGEGVVDVSAVSANRLEAAGPRRAVGQGPGEPASALVTGRRGIGRGRFLNSSHR